jgi:hypothetical protein
LIVLPLIGGRAREDQAAVGVEHHHGLDAAVEDVEMRSC